MIDEEGPECGVVIVCDDVRSEAKQQSNEEREKRGQRVVIHMHCRKRWWGGRTTIERMRGEKERDRKDCVFVISGKPIKNPNSASPCTTNKTNKESMKCRGLGGWGVSVQ